MKEKLCYTALTPDTKYTFEITPVENEFPPSGNHII